MLAGPPTVFRLALPATFAGYRAIELESDPRNEITEAWSDVAPGMPLFESILIVQNLPFLAA